MPAVTPLNDGAVTNAARRPRGMPGVTSGQKCAYIAVRTGTLFGNPVVPLDWLMSAKCGSGASGRSGSADGGESEGVCTAVVWSRAGGCRRV
jgi:hypothetical protein